MPKIVKNGLEYSGTPLEEVTAWPPTGDSVQIEQPLMGSADISEVGDGTVTGAISALNNGTTLLWTNPSPSADFAAQTVSLDLSDYKFVDIYALNGEFLGFTRAIVGQKGVLLYFVGSSSASYGTIAENRTFEVTVNGVGFADNTQVYTGSTITTVNTWNKPKYIYGIK